MRLDLLTVALGCCLGLACSPDGPGGGSDDTGEPAEAGPETSWTVDELGDQAESSDWLFDNSTIHEISIDFDDETEDILWELPPDYGPASVTIDGETVELVGVRLRGKVGSFRYLNEKPKWRIDFNRYVEGQRFHGLEALSLNNSVVDCSYLKEIMAAEVLAALGLPHSRIAFTRLTVNDRDYGLNLIVEHPDDRWLKSNYAEPDGNLYDAKYWYDWSTGNYVLLDFGIGVDEYYELEEGEDVGHVDVSSISNAYIASAGHDDYLETMGGVIDWSLWHRSWAAEQWLGQNDGYVLNRNNTRLYFNPETQLAEQITWDYDYSFLYASDWSRSYRNPTGNLAYACRYDESCEAAWGAEVAEALAIIEALPLQERFDYWKDLIESDIRSDNRRECSSSYVEYYQDWVDDWIDFRASQVRESWGLD